MNEQEAIKEFKERLAIEDFKKDIPEYYAAMEMAVSALEEIGNLEKLREAMEKQMPKRPSEVEEDYFVCPRCGSLITALDDLSTHKHCLNCGQAIDWSEKE